MNAARFAAAGFAAPRVTERWHERGVVGADPAIISAGEVVLAVCAGTDAPLPATLLGFFRVSAGTATL